MFSGIKKSIGRDNRGFVLGMAVIFLLVLGLIAVTFLQFMRQERRRSVHLFHMETGIEAANAAAEMLMAMVEADFADRNSQFYSNLVEHVMEGTNFKKVRISADSDETADKVSYNGVFSVDAPTVKQRFYDLVRWLSEDGRGFMRLNIEMRVEIDEGGFDNLQGFKDIGDRIGAVVTDITADFDYNREDNIPRSEVLIRLKRDLKVVNVLPPFLSKFTLFAREIDNPGAVNRFASGKDGRAVPAPDTMRKPLVLQNHRPGEFGDGSRNSVPAGDPFKSGRIFLGVKRGQELVLHLASGIKADLHTDTTSGTYGETFHFRPDWSRPDEIIVGNNPDPVKNWSSGDLLSGYFDMGHSMDLTKMYAFENDYMKYPVFPEELGADRAYSSALRLWGTGEDISPTLVYGNVFRSWVRLGVVRSGGSSFRRQSRPGMQPYVDALAGRTDAVNPLVNASRFWIGLSDPLQKRSYYVRAWRRETLVKLATAQERIAAFLQNTGAAPPDMEALVASVSAEPLFDVSGPLARPLRFDARMLFRDISGNVTMPSSATADLPDVSNDSSGLTVATADQIFEIPGSEACNDTKPFTPGMNSNMTDHITAYLNVSSAVFNKPGEVSPDFHPYLSYNGGLSEIFKGSNRELKNDAFRPWFDPLAELITVGPEDDILDCMDDSSSYIKPGTFLESEGDRRLYFTGSPNRPSDEAGHPVPRASIYISPEIIGNSRHLKDILKKTEEFYGGWTTLRDYIDLRNVQGSPRLSIKGIIYINSNSRVIIPASLKVDGAGMLIFENEAALAGDVEMSSPNSFLAIVSMNRNILVRGKCEASLIALAPDAKVVFHSSNIDIHGNLAVGKLDMADLSGRGDTGLGGMIAYDFDRMRADDRLAIPVFTMAPYTASFEINPK